MKSGQKYFEMESLLAILLVILAAILTHGVLIPKLGFYRDDWYMLWTAHARGISAVMELFMGDRPFIGYIYSLDYLILGESPLGWHIYALVLEIAGALSFLWLLRLIWPKRHLESTVATILYIVYPGFFQQPNAATYVNLLLAYFCAVLSIAVSIWAIKTNGRLKRVVATLAAVVLMAIYLFIYESLIGMEVVRLLLIGYVLAVQGDVKWKSLVKSLLKWEALYLTAASAFAIWRLFFFESTRRSTRVDLILDRINILPTYSLGGKFFELLRDLVETTILAWAAPYYQFTAQLRYRDLGIGWLISLLVLGLAAIYLFLLRQGKSAPKKEVEQPHELNAWIWLGGLIILVTSLPIVLAGRNVIFAAQFDRYAAQAVIGVALAGSGIAFAALNGRARWALLSLLIFLGASTQYQSAVYYRDLWNLQKDLWWQLSWRAPGFLPGTTLVASLPQGYQLPEDYEVWGPANLIYTSGGTLDVGGQIIFDDILAHLMEGSQVEQVQRGNTVKYDYNKALILSIPSTNACLHVQNGSLPNLGPAEPSDVMMIAPYSKVEMIDLQAKPKTPPGIIFGPEPPHKWCYYFQKIELANQAGQWQEAASLADEAARLNLTPLDRTEWLPIMTAYVNSGQENKALQTAKKIKGDRLTKIFLCTQFERVTEWPSGYNQDLLLSILCTTGKE